MILEKICAFLMSVLITVASAFAALFPQLVPEYDGITGPAVAPNTLPAYEAGTELLTLIADGASDYTIVYGENATSTEKLAAAELQSYLAQITGLTLPVSTDLADSGKETEIVVGKTARAVDALVNRTNLNEDSYTIAVQGKTLLIAGGETRGTLYGIYDFLQDFFGCRFFTADLELVPKQAVAAIPADTLVNGTPAFSFRHTSWRMAQNTRWRSKAHLNGTMTAGHGSMDESDTKLILFGGPDAGHTFRFFVPEEQYFESNPEYFAMDESGKRVAGQVCLSNPEVLELTKTMLAQWIAQYPQANLFSVSQNDNQRYCRCEQCAAIDAAEGSPSGSLLTFVNKVAAYANTIKPGVQIHTFAYQYTVRPPKTVRPAENVLIQLCSIENNHSEPYTVSEPQFCEDVKTWSALCENLILWDYGTNFKHYADPFPDIRILQPNAQMYYENGAAGYFMQANSMCASPEFGELRAYLIAKLLWDPYCDMEKAMTEFLYYYYGTGHENIAAYIEMIEARRCGDIGVFENPAETVKLNVFDLAQIDAWFDACEAAAADEIQLARIQRSRLQVRYYKSATMKAEFFLLREGRVDAGRQLHEDLLRHGVTHLKEWPPMKENPDYRMAASQWNQ